MAAMKNLHAKLFIAALIIGCLAQFVGRPYYQRHVVQDALEVAKGDPTCFFDGQFIQGDVPITRFVPAGEDFLSVWADMDNRFLNSEQAKPFHFGIFIVRGAESAAPNGEAWGWSYRNGEFWPASLEGLFDLSYSGDPAADCLAAQ